jgi:acyl carrier protein
LSAHPSVRRAETAIVRHDGRDVAIAAAELSGYVSGPILRDHVRRELGEDSGLAGVLIVEHMPMADGAVDAACLASALAEGRCTLFEDPRDDVERRVAAIWSAQMDLPSVGVNDDFLELGGDSLSALGIIAAIETEFGRPLDVYEFMSAASVRRLAQILR